MFSVYREWDPLKICVIGRSYPPEFYSWIENVRVRNMFEVLAEKTQDIYHKVMLTLEDHNVNVLQVDLPDVRPHENNFFVFPPVHPRDDLMVIGSTIYIKDTYWHNFYQRVKGPEWDNYSTLADFLQHAPAWQQQELHEIHGLSHELPYINNFDNCYGNVIDKIASAGNQLIRADWADGGSVFRLGDRLIFGTNQNGIDYTDQYHRHFPRHQIDIVNSQGHVDGVFSVICPGLVIAHDTPDTNIDYEKTFPGWEIYRVKQQNSIMTDQLKFLREHNQGRWWIPGMENDAEVIRFVETKFKSWTGNAVESVFDVNMLVIDHKNVLMCTANDEIVSVLNRHGITAHVLDVPYMYFWDGGIHCMTADISRGVT
jgi:hypothetical protein